MGRARRRNRMPAVALLAAAGMLAGGCTAGPEHEVEAEWRRGELPPETLIEDSTPQRSEDGLEFTALRCEVRDDDLAYELDLHNPYDHTLEAWGFTGLDGATGGHLWGLYEFAVPPGRVRVTFPDVLDTEERAEVVATALEEVGGQIGSCSVVLLGIADPPGTPVVHPVITSELPAGPLTDG